MGALVAIVPLVSFIGFESPASWYALFLGLIATFAYVFWYSVFRRPVPPAIAVGATLPELELVDGEGKPVTPTEGKHGLYMFIRGNWCPLCMAQIKELAADYQALADKGAQVVLISPQPHGHTNRLAKKHDVPFNYLTDPKGAAAKQLQIDHPSGVPLGLEVLGYASDTVFPTVVITDEKGFILYVDQTDNYRIRPEPSLFLDVLEGKPVSAV